MTDDASTGQSGPRPNGGTVTSSVESAETLDSTGGIDGRWLRDVGRIAVREYRIAARRRIPAGVTLVFGVFSVGLVLFGGADVGPDRYGAVVASLSELGSYLVPLAALAVGYDVVVGAEKRGVLDVLFALPVSRPQVLLGKFLGRLVVLAGGIFVGLGAGGVATVGYIGLAGLGQYAAFVLAAALTACAFLAVTALISTVARQQTQALGGALAAWVWFVLLHDLGALGLVSWVGPPSLALTGMVLLDPVDVFRVLVLSTIRTAPGGFGSVLAEASLSVPVLVLALWAWVVVPLGLAGHVIRERRA